MHLGKTLTLIKNKIEPRKEEWEKAQAKQLTKSSDTLLPLVFWKPAFELMLSSTLTGGRGKGCDWQWATSWPFTEDDNYPLQTGYSTYEISERYRKDFIFLIFKVVFICAGKMAEQLRTHIALTENLALVLGTPQPVAHHCL